MRRRLRVAAFSTGDEICDPSGRLPPPQSMISNRYALTALLRRSGCEVTDLGILQELKRVIAIAGDRVVAEPTLDEAIASLFGPHQPKTVGSGAQLPPTTATPAAFNADSRTGARPRRERKFGDAMDKLKVLLDVPPPAARNELAEPRARHRRGRLNVQCFPRVFRSKIPASR